ncbi:MULTISPECIES: MFS transporter [unclassified Bradyrhizobium]|uniref:MFS transporter n=1 Tax=unclassified Bradyrhizobium TaxID=2631580 RepID=UPI0028EC792C|nr:MULTISPECIES: MFS transporter [unclassified Bradyrhizobium]
MGRWSSGGAVLGICHVAGMLDLVALPVWVGTFIAFYGLSPAQAGATVTSFLAGIVLASLVTARLLTRLDPRTVVVAGFVVAAAAFGYLASRPVEAVPFAMLPVIHGIAGLAAGAALSMTHGTIGRTENPHRLFGLANVALAVFSVGFFAVVPALVHSVSPRLLFAVFAGSMSLAALAASTSFPRALGAGASGSAASQAVPRPTWLIIAAVICLAFNQSLVFSFLERIGDHKGFSHADVTTVLVAVGLVNLVPGALAALTQRRLSPVAVGIAGPLVQAVLALVIVNATGFAAFAAFAIPYVSVVIFTHTFLFGLLSQIDPSRRAVAATPAMMMIGSAAGPAVAGAIVETSGYGGLSYTAVIISGLAIVLMLTFRVRTAASSQILRSA